MMISWPVGDVNWLYNSFFTKWKDHFPSTYPVSIFPVSTVFSNHGHIICVVLSLQNWDSNCSFMLTLEGLPAMFFLKRDFGGTVNDKNQLLGGSHWSWVYVATPLRSPELPRLDSVRIWPLPSQQIPQYLKLGTHTHQCWQFPPFFADFTSTDSRAMMRPEVLGRSFPSNRRWWHGRVDFEPTSGGEVRREIWLVITLTTVRNTTLYSRLLQID